MHEKVAESDMPMLDEKLWDLKQHSHMLTEYEKEFMQTLCDWTGCYTKRQSETLHTIYKRVVQ